MPKDVGTVFAKTAFQAPFIGALICFLSCLASPAAAEIDKTYTLTVAGFAAPGTPWDADWQTFKRRLDENAGNRIKLKLLIRGEVGGEPITMAGIRRNRIQFGGFSLAGAAAVIPELSVLLSPYFFADQDELDYVMDEHMLAVFRPLFAEKGLHLFRWAEVGWQHIYGQKPLLLPTDARGYRLRTQASDASQILMGALGGDVIQMPFRDLIPALQTGLVTGGGTGVLLYAVTGVSGEAPYLTLTRHTYDTGVVVSNLAWLQRLPADLQKIVDHAFPTSAEARHGVRAMTKALLAKLRGTPGIKVHDLTDSERRIWQEAFAKNHLEIIRRAGSRAAGVYEAMVKGRAAYRALKAKTASGESAKQ